VSSSSQTLAFHLFVKQLLAQQDKPKIDIAWQSGEPANLEFDLFERSLKLFAKHRSEWQPDFRRFRR